ncbi:hypothetical protein AB0J67_25885, partial [Catellatospora sp. NPDC049609]
MLGTKNIRTLLGPADPARGRDVAPPRLSAADLIAAAAARPDADRPAAARRRPPVRTGRRARGSSPTGSTGCSTSRGLAG